MTNVYVMPMYVLTHRLYEISPTIRQIFVEEMPICHVIRQKVRKKGEEGRRITALSSEYDEQYSQVSW